MQSKWLAADDTPPLKEPVHIPQESQKCPREENFLEECTSYNEYDTKMQATKPKANKWDCVTLKSFCTAKKTINNVETQSMEWEEIFANQPYCDFRRFATENFGKPKNPQCFTV
ncbi:hypothetical protein AAY473_013417 [Plecturocebus cupreus]